MIDDEWFACKDPLKTLAKHGWGGSTPRRRRLFACACCRRIWGMLPDAAHRALEASEKFADGLMKQREMVAMLPDQVPLTWENERFGRAMLAVRWACGPASVQTKGTFFMEVTGNTNIAKTGPVRISGIIRHDEAECAAQADLIRCIFGTPCYPPPLSRLNLTATVADLAEAAYRERRLPSGELDPQRLAILADALEDTGARHEVLDHLRGPWPHIRGCWVIDALTGRC